MALQTVPGQRGNPLCPVDLKPEPASESPGGLLKEHWVHPQVSCSAGLGWSPGICNSSKFPVDADGHSATAALDILPTVMSLEPHQTQDL